MRNLVIGGAGFIGVNLSDRLASIGEEVVVFDNFSRLGAHSNATWLRELHPDLRVIEGDVRSDHELLDQLVVKADRVFHLAAQVAVTTSLDDPRVDFETNALGTLNVLEAIRRTGADVPLVFSSTNKVYGKLEELPIVERASRYEFAHQEGVAENQPLDFYSPYGCSKGAADQYVHDYARIFGLRTIVLRQSCIYGPRQFGVEDQGWLAWFAIAALLQRPLTVYGNGKQVRDVLHVDDLIDVMLLACDEIDLTDGAVYNVGGGPESALSLLEAIEQIEGASGVRLEPSFAEERPGDQLVYVSDISRLDRELGWKPRIPLQTGLQNMVDWISANRDVVVEVLHARDEQSGAVPSRR